VNRGKIWTWQNQDCVTWLPSGKL